MRFVVSCLVTVLYLGTTAAFAAAPEPTTDEQKTLYALGLAINQSLGNFTLSEAEFEIVKSGITDGFFKRPKVDLQTFGLKISELQLARPRSSQKRRRKWGPRSSRKLRQNPAPRKPSPAQSLRPSRKGTAQPRKSRIW